MSVRGKPGDPFYDDFKNFLWRLWQHLGLGEPTKLQYALADALQNGAPRKVIEAFRGCGKSWITAAYVLWRLYRDAQERILVVSASKERADQFVIFCRRLIEEIPLLHWMRPGPGQRDSIVAFDVGPAGAHQSPSLKAAGITGQITGSRAHRIVADDIEIPNNSATQTMRDKIAEGVKEFEAIIIPEGPKEITFLGTPQTEMTLYNELRARGYEMLVIPARVPTPEDCTTVYGATLAPFIREMADNPNLIGRTTEPQRFTDTDLIERELSYGKSGFAMQFMLNPRIGDSNRYPLKVHDLMVMSLDPREAPAKLVWGRDPDLERNDLPNLALPGDLMYRPMFRDPQTAPYNGCVMFVDPSGRGKDETGVAIVKMLHGNLYCVECTGFIGGYDPRTLQEIGWLALKHGVKHIRVEENFGDGMFTALLRPVLTTPRPEDDWPGYPVVVEDYHSTGQREKRIIDTLEPIMNQHRLVIDDEVIRRDYEYQNLTGGLENVRNYQLIYQLTRLTHDRGSLRHDDRVEALAGAVAYWIEQVGVDQDKKKEQHRQHLIDEELRRFMKHAIGRPRAPGGVLGSRGRSRMTLR